MNMTDCVARSRFALAVAATALSLVTAAQAVELDPAAVVYKTPEQFQWRDPSDKADTNRTVLFGDPSKPGLYIYINTFKAGLFGNPHYHPNDRFIVVTDGATWKGTGTVVDPAHALRLPKGSFTIDHALKVHWDISKEESGAALITGYGPRDAWAGRAHGQTAGVAIRRRIVAASRVENVFAMSGSSPEA